MKKLAQCRLIGFQELTILFLFCLLLVGCSSRADNQQKTDLTSEDVVAESSEPEMAGAGDIEPQIRAPAFTTAEPELQDSEPDFPMEAAPEAAFAAPLVMKPLPPPAGEPMPRSAVRSAIRMAQPELTERMMEQQALADSEPEPESQAKAMKTVGPMSQTTINVFYATDRQSKYGILPGDWLKVHGAALIVGIIYLVAFLSVLFSTRKVLAGAVAFGALAGLLVLGQSAMVEWQKLKRLESNEDVVYLSELRPSTTERLDYGSCEVTIPPIHQTGHLDSPSLFKLEFSENPEKHVVLNRVIRSTVDEFYGGLVNAMDKKPTRQAMVFIHGYNVSFENAVKRTAQIAYDLKFAGAPICYSWSSHGALSNYTRDLANADATVVALQSFLQETVRRTGNSTIHLVAHSMGNRALLQALDRIAIGNPQTPKLFGQLVMAAPDVSVHDFRSRFADAAMKLAKSVTLYASSRDKALLASTEIHGHDRAGMAGENLVVIDGMDTIDVSEIDTSLIGHSYYGDHPELIRDLQALVELSQPASQRQWLTRIISPGGFGYFRFVENLRQPETAADSQRDRR